MYCYLSSQSQGYTTPTFSAGQIQSLDQFQCQNQNESSPNFTNELTPSFPSTYRGPNPTVSKNTSIGSRKDQISLMHEFKQTVLPKMDISKDLEKEHLKLAENQLIQKFKYWNTKIIPSPSVYTLNSSAGHLVGQDQYPKIVTKDHGKSEFYLLNPIFLLARLRTPQYAIQFSTEKVLSDIQDEEFGLESRSMLTYDSKSFEKIEINSIFSKPWSGYESSSCTCSPDSLFTDESPETSICEYYLNPIFMEDKDLRLDIGPQFVCLGGDSFIDSFPSKSEYIYPTQFRNRSKEIGENTLGYNTTNFNSTVYFMDPNFDNQLLLSPTVYNFMPNKPNSNCAIITQVNNSYVDGDCYDNNNNINNSDRSDQSLTKFPSLLKIITQSQIQPGQLSNNLIPEKCIKPNLLKDLNDIDTTSEILNHEHLALENAQKINDLTEDSLAAHQRALESAACNDTIDAGFFRTNIGSEEYLQAELEIYQSSLSNDSYEASSQEINSFSDEFENDFDFDFDDDTQDCAFIEAVNAEALANDFDGFYGQEFGLYSTPDMIGKNASYANGDYSRNTGLKRTHSSRNSRFGSHAPILSPITECSEFSFCSPCSLHSANLNRETSSSGLEQVPSAKLTDNLESINNFDSLLKSRQELWGENQNSAQDFCNYSYWSSDSE